MRWVRTRVLPEPAPARISTGPSPCVTASRCGSFKPSSSAAPFGGASLPDAVALTSPRIVPRAAPTRSRRRVRTGPGDGAHRSIRLRAMRRVRAHATLPLYVGGFLGPFGGAIVAVLIPQLRDSFDASTAAVAASIPAYLVPFALVQLVSG